MPVLRSLLTFGTGCGGAGPGDTGEGPDTPLASVTAAVSDANLYDSFTRANSASLGSLEQGGQAWKFIPSGTRGRRWWTRRGKRWNLPGGKRHPFPRGRLEALSW